MAGRQVALIRGINVGRAKRVTMADLRELVSDLGYRDVRTLLNSGNVVFTAGGAGKNDAAARIEKGLAKRLGVPAKVTVMTARELAVIVTKNPLVQLADNPSRLLVAFLAAAADRSRLEPLARRDWSPEALAIGARVAYLWCPNGVLASPLAAEVDRALRDAVTSRNWATVQKLHALTKDSG